jgi:hypothetical protein
MKLRQFHLLSNLSWQAFVATAKDQPGQKQPTAKHVCSTTRSMKFGHYKGLALNPLSLHSSEKAQSKTARMREQSSR